MVVKPDGVASLGSWDRDEVRQSFDRVTNLPASGMVLERPAKEGNSPVRESSADSARNPE